MSKRRLKRLEKATEPKEQRQKHVAIFQDLDDRSIYWVKEDGERTLVDDAKLAELEEKYDVFLWVKYG